MTEFGSVWPANRPPFDARPSGTPADVRLMRPFQSGKSASKAENAIYHAPCEVRPKWVVPITSRVSVDQPMRVPREVLILISLGDGYPSIEG